MENSSVKLLKRNNGFTLLKTSDGLGFNNYVVVNEGTKDYYQVSVAKNATLSESVNNENYYTIKKNGEYGILEDMYELFPFSIAKNIDNQINEVEEFIDDNNSDEVLDLLVDVLTTIGYKPRHIIQYDDTENSLDYEFVVIISGSIDTIYLSVSTNGDVFVKDVDYQDEHYVGSTEDPKGIEKLLSMYLSDLENTTILGEDYDDEVIKEAFKQEYGIVINEGRYDIYKKSNLKECGYIDRKLNVYKFNDSLSQYGIETIKLIAEGYEIRTLLSENIDDNVTDSKNFEIFKTIFLNKPIKISNDNFDGEIVITNPEFKMMTWIGEPHPTVKFDISFTNINQLKNLIANEDDIVYDFNKTPELKYLLHSLTNFVGVNSTVLYRVRKTIEGSIKKKLKYFGLGELNPSIKGMKVNF